jgi:hypothetical protein
MAEPEGRAFGRFEGLYVNRAFCSRPNPEIREVAERTVKNMAMYKDSLYLTQNADRAFDNEHSPDFHAPRSGIYRCGGCGREAACNQGESLPPQNHHQHNTNQGKIRWKLVVYADHREK